jgi:hypothetical protein
MGIAGRRFAGLGEQQLGVGELVERLSERSATPLPLVDVAGETAEIANDLLSGLPGADEARREHTVGSLDLGERIEFLQFAQREGEDRLEEGGVGVADQPGEVVLGAETAVWEGKGDRLLARAVLPLDHIPPVVAEHEQAATTAAAAHGRVERQLLASVLGGKPEEHAADVGEQGALAGFVGAGEDD